MENTEEKKIKREPQDIILKIIKELVPYLIIIFVVVTIRTFIVTPVRVNGASMYPYL